MAPITIHVQTSLHKGTLNSPSQQGGTPHYQYTTSNKHTRYYTLTNVGNSNNHNQEQTVLEWLIACTCSQTRCQCHPRLRPNILCIIGALIHTPIPLLPSHIYIVQFIKSHTATTDSWKKPSHKNKSNTTH